MGSGGRGGGRSRNRQRYVQAIVVTPLSKLPLGECLMGTRTSRMSRDSPPNCTQDTSWHTDHQTPLSEKLKKAVLQFQKRELPGAQGDTERVGGRGSNFSRTSTLALREKKNT